MKKGLPAMRFLAVVAACFALAACDVLTSPATRLERAAAALEQGNPEAALADARKVAEKDAGNVQAWLLLARISLKYGDAAGALRNIESAKKAGGSDELIRPVRDDALLQSGGFDELLALPAQTPAQMVAHATALASLGRKDESGKLIDEVLAKDGSLASARLVKVRLLLADGQLSAARQALDALLTDQPANAQAWMLKGRVAMMDGDTAAAIEALSRAEPEARKQLNIPEQATLLVALIESQLSAGQADAASGSLAKMQKLASAAPVTAYLSARVSLAQGDASTAVATLQTLLAKVPDYAPARLLLGAALLEQGSVEQARSQLTSLIAEQPENMEARKLLARLHVSQGDTAAADRVLTDLPEGVRSDPTADWMRSAILSMSGDRAESLVVLEQAAKGDPSNVQLQLDLARAYLAAGRRDDAARVLQGVPEQKSGPAGKQLQVLSRVMGQSAEQARRTLVAMGEEHPKDAQLRTVIGQFLLQTGDPEAADAQFRAALAETAGLVEARMGLAGVALRKGEFDAARKELKQVTVEAPRYEQAYLALAAIAVRQKDAKEARQWLEQCISVLPSAVTARLGLAELSYNEKQVAAADALLEQAVAVARDKPTAMLMAGDVQLRAAQTGKAISFFDRAYTQRPSSALAVRLYVARKAEKQPGPDAILRQWLKRQPGDAAARAALAEHLLSQDSLREAIAEYEQLAKATPSPVLLNNLAWAYQKVGDGKAESTAKRAYDAAPGNPSIADTYGWILLEKGRTAEALPLLEKAAKAMPENADVQANYKRARAATEK
jgi:putative PEP-CTERM system TPR-repeat lipoprotein